MTRCRGLHCCNIEGQSGCGSESLCVSNTTTKLTCKITASSTQVQTTSSTNSLEVGMLVSGDGIPSPALIESISSSTAFTMTEEATASTSATLIFTTFPHLNNTTIDGMCLGAISNPPTTTTNQPKCVIPKVPPNHGGAAPTSGTCNKYSGNVGAKCTDNSGCTPKRCTHEDTDCFCVNLDNTMESSFEQPLSTNICALPSEQPMLVATSSPAGLSADKCTSNADCGGFTNVNKPNSCYKFLPTSGYNVNDQVQCTSKSPDYFVARKGECMVGCGTNPPIYCPLGTTVCSTGPKW